MDENTPDSRTGKIAAHIKKLREEAGYTSHESFAYDHEINRMQYWRLEKGANMRLSSLYRILDIHKLTLEEFAKGAGI
ncbi:MAG: XRE family transcriptional regulator [Flavobacteriales bacterium]|nr:XRE family transcriptional regulator [Flavobacteriales bacterium]